MFNNIFLDIFLNIVIIFIQYKKKSFDSFYQLIHDLIKEIK